MADPPLPFRPDMKVQGSEHYVATDDLTLAVNAAITLKRPLLVKGEPGTGKTLLAEEAAKALGAVIAKKALEKGITEVMVDRGGRVYHGRIKALADSAREAGLKF